MIRIEPFFDTTLIAEKSGVKHVRAKLLKERDVVLKNDKPYEGELNGYYSIIKDGEQNYRIYYRGQSKTAITCIAESQDGVEFSKPSNHKILDNVSYTHNFAPTKTKDGYVGLGGSKSFKHQSINGIHLLESKDGVKWDYKKRIVKQEDVLPQSDVRTYFDAYNQVVPFKNKYHFYVRYNPGVGIRSVQHCISDTYTTIKKFKEISVRGKQFSTQYSIYSLNAVNYPNSEYLIAFPCKQIGNKSRTKHVGMMYSRDGFTWTEITDELNPKMKGPHNFVCGLVDSVYKSKYYLYFQDISTHNISCWSVRKDGFNSLVCRIKGYIKTKPIRLANFNLKLNCKAEKNGHLSVELYNSQGVLIDTSQQITGNKKDVGINWQKKTKHTDGLYSIKVLLKNSSLYSLTYHI